ncbi:MAG: hypothetical protein GY765_33900 [bacterium]|nr:hypothetical protein [bacterium]
MPLFFILRRSTAVLIVFLIFLTWAGMLARNPQSPKDNELQRILEGTAAYCEKLKKEAFHFLCLEQITETCEKAYVFPQERQGLKDFFEKNVGNRPVSEADSKNRVSRINDEKRQKRIAGNYRSQKYSKKNILVNEYRILKEGSRIKELRTPVKYNGNTISRDPPPMQTILYSYKNTLSPIYLFAAGNQALYRYKILGKKKIMKRSTFVVEIDRKAGKNRKTAVAWVDTENFSIVKLRIYPEAFHGYHYLPAPVTPQREKGVASGGQKGVPTTRFDVKVNDVHYFGHIKNGIRFPSSTEIHLSYKEEAKKGIDKVRHGAVVLTTLSTLYTYGEYLFFRTKSSEPVFKREKK